MRYIYLPLMLIGALPALFVLAAVEWGFGIEKISGNVVGAASIVFGIFICAFLIWIIIF